MIKKKVTYESDFLRITKVTEDSGKTFEVCERLTSYVGIIAVTKGKKIVLVKEKRYPYKDRIYSLPSGAVDKEKGIKSGAQRELQEEAGYRAGKMTLFMRNMPSIFLRQNIYIFVARNLTPSPLPIDDDEDIQVEEKSLDECVRLALDGKLRPDLSALAVLRFKDVVDRGSL